MPVGITEVDSAEPQAALRTAALCRAVAGHVPVRNAFAGSLLGGLLLFTHRDLHQKTGRISDAKGRHLA